MPPTAREDAIRQVLDLGTPVLLTANRQFHRLLVTGVPVQYQRDGETRGDFVRLVDWADPACNEWLAVNQFAITGAHRTRRPDIVLFVNGLPLVLIELKNPADLNADVWKAFHQIQTYKAQIADVFQYNEVLVDLPMNRFVVCVEVPDDVWAARTVRPAASLPVGWTARPEGKVSLDAGDAWLAGGASVLMEVPSVIVNEESNVLINPRHADAAKLRSSKVRPWFFDERLKR